MLEYSADLRSYFSHSFELCKWRLKKCRLFFPNSHLLSLTSLPLSLSWLCNKIDLHTMCVSLYAGLCLNARDDRIMMSLHPCYISTVYWDIYTFGGHKNTAKNEFDSQQSRHTRTNVCGRWGESIIIRNSLLPSVTLFFFTYVLSKALKYKLAVGERSTNL